MTLPHFSQAQFIEYLAKFGWIENSNKDWETHNRIMISDGKDIITFQLRATYYFNHTVKLCDSLGVPSPEEHRRCYDQLSELKNREKDKISDEEE